MTVHRGMLLMLSLCSQVWVSDFLLLRNGLAIVCLVTLDLDTRCLFHVKNILGLVEILSCFDFRGGRVMINQGWRNSWFVVFVLEYLILTGLDLSFVVFNDHDLFSGWDYWFIHFAELEMTFVVCDLEFVDRHVFFLLISWLLREYLYLSGRMHNVLDVGHWRHLDLA